MNAANYQAFKDFRKNIDIKQKLKRGSIDRKIFLPHEGITYGKPNRPPTPIKDIINNNYGTLAEMNIRNEYKNFIKKVRSQSNFNVRARFEKTKKMLEEKRKKLFEERKSRIEIGNKYNSISAKIEKAPYKLKMFMDVKSKVAENLKMFKSYRPYQKKIKIARNINDALKDSANTNIDDMINKVQDDIKQQQQKEEEKKQFDTLPAI